MNVLTKEEAMADDKKNWQLIRHGCIFDFGGIRFFIATREVNNETWEVIELTANNRAMLMEGRAVMRIMLKLSDAYSLNLH